MARSSTVEVIIGHEAAITRRAAIAAKVIISELGRYLPMRANLRILETRIAEIITKAMLVGGSTKEGN